MTIILDHRFVLLLLSTYPRKDEITSIDLEYVVPNKYSIELNTLEALYNIVSDLPAGGYIMLGNTANRKYVVYYVRDPPKPYSPPPFARTEEDTRGKL